MLGDKDIKLLRWFFNRLVYKHRLSVEDAAYQEAYRIILKLDSKDTTKIVIDDSNLDKIISKYYVDFQLEKCERLGYTEVERQQLRQIVLNLTEDIYNFSRIGLDNNVTTN